MDTMDILVVMIAVVFMAIVILVGACGYYLTKRFYDTRTRRDKAKLDILQFELELFSKHVKRIRSKQQQQNRSMIKPKQRKKRALIHCQRMR